MLFRSPNDAEARRREEKRDESLQLIHSIATLFNELVSQSVNAGWQFLRRKINSSDPSYFDPVFTQYLRSQVIVTGAPFSSDSSQGKLPTVTVCCGRSRTSSVPPVQTLEYGLGFDKLFTDLSPNLMNMLLVVSASANPYKTANCLINRMEQKGPQGRAAPVPVLCC